MPAMLSFLPRTGGGNLARLNIVTAPRGRNYFRWSNKSFSSRMNWSTSWNWR